ncbi:hypothetical protein Taro_025949 [Colocasia esculenta]|uniref:Translocator protein n=1 Tax=Colocasia esculenta TaxID=4460 RepID=A0A843VJ41_COLES|nr:hypothetical protein [Colocasia esculenta]
MSPQSVRRRSKDEPTPGSAAAAATTGDGGKNLRARKMAMAKRGLRSLSVALATPLCLTLLTTYLFGATRGYAAVSRPFWRPPVWAFHLASLSSACLMGLSAWLVWADGGFRRQPAALPLYLTELALSLAWGPVVLGAGAMRLGLAVCMALFAALLGCSQLFRRVNPIAGDLVKPCLAWVCFLAVCNYKMLM